MCASCGSLFVSLKINASQSKFETKLMRDLDERFMKIKDCSQWESMRRESEADYRTATKGKIEGIEVEVKRDRDDITIALKGILSAVEKLSEKAKMIPARQVKVTLFCIFLAVLAAIILELQILHELNTNRQLIDANAKALHELQQGVKK